MAHLIGVPFIKLDATKFSATGYVGGDIEDALKGLVTAANGDVALAEYGIVYIDEVDKLAAPPQASVFGSASAVNTRDVQTTLLKVMEDGEISLSSTQQQRRPNVPTIRQQQQSSPAQVLRTKNVLFIFSGAFNSLHEHLKAEGKGESQSTVPSGSGTEGNGERGTAAVGDGVTDANADADSSVPPKIPKPSTKQLVDAGFEPEFIGRLPVRVACQHLRADDLLSILTDAEDSVLKQFEEDFLGYDIALETDEAALRLIAHRAEDQGTGARGLLTILDDILREYKYELPSTDISTLGLSTDMVNDPEAHLTALLQDAGPCAGVGGGASPPRPLERFDS